jgi:hypothetical protein
LDKEKGEANVKLANDLKRYLDLQKQIVNSKTDDARLSKEIATIQSDITDLVDKEYKSIISDIKNQEEVRVQQLEASYKTQKEAIENTIEGYNDQIAALEAKAELEDTITERQQRQVELTKLQTELENIRNNRNIQILQKDASGKWQFAYVADPERIDDLTQQIKDKTENFAQWEKNQTVKAEKARINALIEAERDKLTALESNFNREKLAYDNFFVALNNSTATGLNNLDGTFSTYYNNILKTVQEKVASILATQSQVTSQIYSGSGSSITASSILSGAQGVIAQTIASGGSVTKSQAISAGFKFADGTNDAPGGISLVGEKGPELVNLPKGAGVVNNRILTSFMKSVASPVSRSNSAGGATYVIQNVNLPNVKDVVDFIDELKNLPARALQFSRSNVLGTT